MAATFLLTDVQGSTRMWAEAPEDASAALASLDEIIADAVDGLGGRVIRSRGEGDSAFCVFPEPIDAVRAALETQLAIHAELWPPGAPIRVRMAVHTGDAEERDGQLYGMAVNHCARLRDAAVGGQILVSALTAALVDGLPSGADLVPLGSVRLRDIEEPVEVLSVVHEDLPAAMSPVAGIAVQHNLPAPTTSFVGRDEVLRRIAKLLAEHRLVTLLGPGGVGKTRTALRVAMDIEERFPDGVRLVELASVGSSPEAAPAAAAALGVEVEPGTDPIDAFLQHLGSRRMLVILDNAEHVVEGAAELAGSVIRRCPEATVLVTSRTPLRVRGEHRFPLPPLEVPEPEAGAEEIAESEAVRLFVERAAAARPDGGLDPDDAEAVATICRRLEGVPLAIELAAARSGVLTPSQVAERLGERVSVLAAGPQDVSERHRTLDGVVAWSHDLLTEADRGVFRRLAIFDGGCTLDAAEAVCAGDEADRGRVLDAIAELVDQSLLVAEREGDRMRYRMLEGVRVFAAARLDEAGERDRTAEAHLAWCARMAAAYDASVTSDEPGELDAVAAELPNVRSALRFAASPHRASVGLQLVSDLLDFWQNRAIAEGASHAQRFLELHADRDLARLRGLYLHGVLHDTRDLSVARASLEEAFGIAAELGEEEWLARLRTTLSVVARLGGDLDEAEAHARSALTAFEDAGDERWEAQAAEVLARVMESRGRFAEAKELHERALLAWERRGEIGRMRYPLINLGAVHQVTGDLDAAWDALTRAAGIARERGDHKVLVVATTNLGRVALGRGEVERARRMFEESLVLSTELDSAYDIAYARFFLGNHARQVADPRRARDHYRRALDLFERNGNAIDADIVRVLLGRIALIEGDTSAARTACEASLRRAGERRDDYSSCEFLESLAFVAAAEADMERAATLFGAVDRLREVLGVPRELVDQDDWDRWTQEAREALGPEGFEAARGRGGSLSLEGAVSQAVDA